MKINRLENKTSFSANAVFSDVKVPHGPVRFFTRKWNFYMDPARNSRKEKKRKEKKRKEIKENENLK